MGSDSKTVIHCPATGCSKPLMSQVAMAEGTRFVMRCFYCGCYVKIIVSFTTIHKKQLQSVHQGAIIESEANATSVE